MEYTVCCLYLLPDCIYGLLPGPFLVIQSNEFRRAQVILYAGISIRQHLYTNWLISSSSQVSVEIKQNLLIRPVFIESVLKGINSITLHHRIW